MTFMDVLKNDFYGCFEVTVMEFLKWLLWMFLNDCYGCFKMTVMDVLK